MTAIAEATGKSVYEVLVSAAALFASSFEEAQSSGCTDAKEDPSGWIVEDACSAPQTEAFWDGIFADMSSSGGLAVFKQDHGGGEIVQLVAAQRNLSVMENWLGPQGRAAAKVSRC